MAKPETECLIEISVQEPLKTGDYTESGDIVTFDEKPWPRRSDGGQYINCITIVTKSGQRLADCYSGRILRPDELAARLKYPSQGLHSTKPKVQ